MIVIRPGRDGDPAHWRLISRTTIGADVIATAPIGPARPAGEAWRRAVERLRDGAGKLQVLPVAGGHYEWALTGPGGEIIARSPAPYRDAEGCRQAYATARRAARTVLGAGLP
jgi:hypothetical protein